MVFFSEEKLCRLKEKKGNFLKNFPFCLLPKKNILFIFLVPLIFFPLTARASVELSLSPSSGTHEERSVFSVDVLVKGDGDAVEGTLNFDNNLLTVESISDVVSVVEAWAPGGRPSQSGGNITFRGGIPGGLGRREGNVFTVNFRALRSGTASVKFTEGRVLKAGESLAVNLGSASYTIKEAVRRDTTDSSLPPSTGHLPPPPDDFFEEDQSENDYFIVKVDDGGDPLNLTPSFIIDEEERLDKVEYYEIFLNDELHDTVYPIDLEDKRYKVSPLSPGEYLLEIRAFDEEGNYVSAFEEFFISSLKLEIKEISSSISKGRPLTIIGQTIARAILRIYILVKERQISWEAGSTLSQDIVTEYKEKIIVRDLIADESGEFIFQETFPEGEYLVWLEAENREGTAKNKTEIFSVEVKEDDWIFILIGLLFILILFGTGLIMFFRKKIKDKEKKKNSSENNHEVAKKEAHNVLEEKVKEQISYLEEKTDLSRGERRVLEGLKNALGDNFNEEDADGHQK